MAIKVRALLSLVVLLTSMVMVGCGHYTCGTTFGNSSCNGSGGGLGQGGGQGTGLKVLGYFVDFSHLGQPSAGIAEQKLDASAGTFITISSFLPPVVPPFATGLVIVQKKFMYSSSSDGNVFGYTIDLSTGNIASLAGSPYAAVGGTSIASNRAGNLIFVGDVTGQRISVFTVNVDGTLAVVAGSPFATSGVSPRVMAADGSGKFLYVTDGVGSTQMGAYAIGTGGVLTAVAGNPFALNMAAIAGDASGKYLVGVTAQASDNKIHVFSIGSTDGSLTEVTNSPFSTVNTPLNLAIHPNGAWVYTFNQDSLLHEIQPMEGFTLSSATGALTEITGSPFLTLTANGGAIEPSGQFLIGLGVTVVGGFSESTSTPFNINSNTGALSVTLNSLGFPGIDAAAYAVTDGQ